MAGFKPAFAEGIVSKVTSAPIFANGIVRDVRSGINIFLQTDQNPGDAFLDPAVPGYGIPPGGRMEIEMVSGLSKRSRNSAGSQGNPSGCRYTSARFAGSFVGIYGE